MSATKRKIFKKLSEACDVFQQQYGSMITEKDVRMLLQTMSHHYRESDIQSILNRLNMREDGTMPLNEFIKLMLDNVLNLENIIYLRQDCEEIDNEHKGYITAGELLKDVQQTGSDVSMEELLLLLKNYTKNNEKEKFYYEEFLEEIGSSFC